MILYEFEGKELLSKSGVNVPNSQLLKSRTEKINLNFPFYAKAQVLSGKRKDVGGILEIKDASGMNEIQKMFGTLVNKELVDTILIEEKIDIKNEYYISLSYDTKTHSPVFTFSGQGGTGIEERGAQSFPVDPIYQTINFGELEVDSNLKEVFNLLVSIFFSQDLTLLEVNPLVVDHAGKIWALDAKLKTDDNASVKHPDWNFPPRAIPGYKPTEREIEAKKIDEGDYRGTAGSAYFDLPGDIAVLASGGGGSLTAMDALLKAGGKPANYTEYSGNPPKEKVEKLTKIVLSKKDLNGLWVVGAIANFTDIYETLSGLIEALRTISPKPKFPIVIRRGGPRDAEAFEMLRNVKDFDLHLYGQEISITESAKIMASEAKRYAATSK